MSPAGREGNDLPSPCKGEADSRVSGSPVGVPRTVPFNRTPTKTRIARRLRRDATVAEVKLWRHLRAGQVGGVGFRRQHPAGRYVLDFYCPTLMLAVELDGGQHGMSNSATNDTWRTAWLESRGVTVLRFWNNDVMGNIDGVLQVLVAEIERLRDSRLTPTRRWRADLPLSGGGGAAPASPGT